MGREVKRVRSDFDWPLGKVWEGFLNPHYRACPENCEGGYSAEYRGAIYVDGLFVPESAGLDLKGEHTYTRREIEEAAAPRYGRAGWFVDEDGNTTWVDAE